LVEAYNEAQRIGAVLVCVGDYVDSFVQTNKNQEKVLEFIAEHPDIIPLIGNHDIQYIASKHNTHWQCTGYRSGQYNQFNSRFWKIKWKWYFAPDDALLVTHAGLTNDLIERYDFTSMADITDYLESETKHVMSYMSTYHFPWDIPIMADGSDGTPGGILWNRYRTVPGLNYVHAPIKGIKQVFGHTFNIDKGVQKVNGTDWCVDCLYNSNEFVLYNTETKVISPHRFSSIPTEHDIEKENPHKTKIID
jgi:hypothetical protein